jgi:hypothetical protein
VPIEGRRGDLGTIVRRKHAVRTLGPYRRHELLTGRIKYPAQGYTGYGDGCGKLHR